MKVYSWEKTSNEMGDVEETVGFGRMLFWNRKH